MHVSLGEIIKAHQTTPQQDRKDQKRRKLQSTLNEALLRLGQLERFSRTYGKLSKEQSKEAVHLLAVKDRTVKKLKALKEKQTS